MSDRNAFPALHTRRTHRGLVVTCDAKLAIRGRGKLRFLHPLEKSGKYWNRLGDAAKYIVEACLTPDVRLVVVSRDGAEVFFRDGVDDLDTAGHIQIRLGDVCLATGHVAVEVSGPFQRADSGAERRIAELLRRIAAFDHDSEPV